MHRSAIRSLAVAFTVALAACKGADGAVGPQGAQGPAGPAGPQGAPGNTANTWYSGATPPQASIGVNGDYYFQTVTGLVYQKANGAWGQIANLMGPAGATGATGATGPQGPAGANGASGTSTSGGATRISLTGVLTLSSGTSGAVRTLPSGVTFSSPPVVTCYVADSADPTVWVNISDVTSTSSATYACGLVATTTGVSAVMIAPSSQVGKLYAIVVVY